MVNSSPASRASSGRVRALPVYSALTTTRRRLATMIRSWSPRAWPRLSLTILKRSRSTNSIADSACRALAHQLVGFGTEMEAVGQRGHRIVHAERVRIFDRGAHLGEQAVDRGGELGHVAPDRCRRGRHQVAILDCKQPLAERGECAGAFAVRPFGGDVADQQAKHAGDERGDDLLIEFGQVEKRGQREQKRRESSGTRQDRVADLLGRACGHLCLVRLARRTCFRLQARGTDSRLRKSHRTRTPRRRTR